jgi:hypothetical protein
MDPTTIGALLTSLKAATDIAKFIRGSDLSIERAELKLKLAELVEALANAKLEAADVQQQSSTATSRFGSCRPQQSSALKSGGISRATTPRILRGLMNRTAKSAMTPPPSFLGCTLMEMATSSAMFAEKFSGRLREWRRTGRGTRRHCATLVTG